MDQQNVTNQREWESPGNWIGGVIYRSSRDSRLLVPKRTEKWGPFSQTGWTLNFGNRRSYLVLLGLSSVPIGFVLLFVLHRLSQ